MSDRKLLALFVAALVIVSGVLWVVALVFLAPANKSLRRSSSEAQALAAVPSPAKSVETSAEALKRAKRYLQPPTTRESILAAQLALRSIPASASQYKEAQTLLTRSDIDLKAAETRAKAEEIRRLRERLQSEYERLLSDANPHLNYISTKLHKHKGGFALWGVHTYFTQYTFSIGADAKIVSAWINQNHSDLTRAGILRVGVMSRESWGGSCWFDV